MAVQTWESGIVGSAAGSHRTLYPGVIRTRRTVWWVDGSKSNASDNSSNHGYSPLVPLATIAYAAVTAASDTDMIVVPNTHGSETLSVTISAKGLSIFGLGAYTSQVALTCALTGSSTKFIFTASADGFELRNFRLNDAFNFDTSAYGEHISWGASGCVLGECNLYCSGPNPLSCQWTTGTLLRLENSTWRSTATSPAASNFILNDGVLLSSGTKGLQVVGCTFDGGTAGWGNASTGAAIRLASGTHTNFQIINSTFTGGPRVNISLSGAKGFLSNNTMAASCHVIHDTLRWFDGGLAAYAAATGGNGNPIVNGPNFACSGTVWWVDSATGSNSNAGTEPHQPFATLAAALAAQTAANGDIIVLFANHTETVGTSSVSFYTPGADTKIFGLGSGNTRPQFTLIPDATTPLVNPTRLFNLSASGVELHGIRFNASTVAHTDLIAMSSDSQQVEGCSFTCGAYDGSTIVLTNAKGFRITSCDFTVSAAGPVYGIRWGDGGVYVASYYYSDIDGCTFDGGAAQGLEWSGGAVYHSAGSASMCAFLTNTLRDGAEAIFANSAWISSGTIADANARTQWSG